MRYRGRCGVVLPHPSRTVRQFPGRPARTTNPIHRMNTMNASFLTSALLRARGLGCALAVCAAAALSAPSHAQFGGRAGFAKAFAPDILQRDITLINSMLQLEEWQRPIVEALMQDYVTSYQLGADDLRDKLKAAQQAASGSGNTNPDAILDELMKPIGPWMQEKQRLAENFLTNLKSQLGPQQLERWPSFERALRRERFLSDSDLSGEGVDLWAVMARMEPTPEESEATKPAFAQYEIVLDEALMARERTIDSVQEKLQEAMKKMDFDGGAKQQAVIMTARVAVRVANDAAIDSIANAMGARGGEFRRMALEAGYPDVFRIHPVMVLMQQARDLDGISAEQRSQIEALMTEFSAACGAENLKLLDAVRAEQPKAPQRRAEASARRMAGGASGAPGAGQGPSQDDPIVKGRLERDRMGQPYRERLLAILTPEQQAMLPGAVKIDPAGISKENANREKGAAIGSVESNDAPLAKDRRTREPGPRDPRRAAPAGGADPSGKEE